GKAVAIEVIVRRAVVAVIVEAVVGNLGLSGVHRGVSIVAVFRRHPTVAILVVRRLGVVARRTAAIGLRGLRATAEQQEKDGETHGSSGLRGSYGELPWKSIG